MEIGRHGRGRLRAAGAAAILAVGALAGASPTAAAGLTPVGLGGAAAFAVLAGTPAVTNSGSTIVWGDLGIHPAASITGFPPGVVNGTIHAGDDVALQAKVDLVAAYDDAAGRTPAGAVAGGALGGLTLVAGVYSAGGATLGLTGALTLDGQNDPNAVWIFQATSDLVTAASSSVTFINGGQACNVFWQVASSATLGADSEFAGTILALSSITMLSRVTLTGRALARNGTVTLMNDAIGYSPCVVPSPTVAPATPGAPAVASTPPDPTIGTTLPPTDIVLTQGLGSGTGPLLLIALIVAIGLTAAVVVDRRLFAGRRAVAEPSDDGSS